MRGGHRAGPPGRHALEPHAQRAGSGRRDALLEHERRRRGGAPLRAHQSDAGAEQNERGSCSERAKACSYAVSAGASALLLEASEDGSKALYSEGGELYEYRRASRGSRPLDGGEVAGVVGSSEDLGRVYLVSGEALDAGAQAGKPNLYLEEGGAFTLVATLGTGAGGKGLDSPASTSPFYHASEVSADGGRRRSCRARR